MTASEPATSTAAFIYTGRAEEVTETPQKDKEGGDKEEKEDSAVHGVTPVCRTSELSLVAVSVLGFR